MCLIEHADLPLGGVRPFVNASGLEGNKRGDPLDNLAPREFESHSGYNGKGL